MESKSVQQTQTVVIGAGQAGLAMSRELAKRGNAHVVLERGRVGNSWRTQRWDSFRLNTLNRINVLPDGTAPGPGEGFGSADDLVQTFEEYRRQFDLPVLEGVAVTRVRRTDYGFTVETSEGDWSCTDVVICSGDQNVPVTPPIAKQLPNDLDQLHAADYRRAADLRDGAVLVVGSGQSGVQITEDLLDAGRSVYVCSSLVGRAPRRYRGRDITDWVTLTGLAHQRPEDLADPNEIYARQGQISGVDGGRSVSLHLLARRGATVVGRLAGVEGRTLQIGDDLLANVARGDEGVKALKAGLDGLITKMGLDAPEPELDPADVPFDDLDQLAAIRSLELDETGIRTVIWATGFTGNFDYLDPALLDERGRPRHQAGVCPIPGLYCVGLTWLRQRISGLIAGAADDAEQLAQLICDEEEDLRRRLAASGGARSVGGDR